MPLLQLRILRAEGVAISRHLVAPVLLATLAYNLYVQILPGRIHGLDQFNLLTPRSGFDLFFAMVCAFGICIHFVVDQFARLVPARETTS